MIIPRTSSVVTSFLLTVPTSLPWYITLIRSDRSNTSWMSWLTRKIPMPSLLSCRMRACTCAVSAGPSAAVGSSLIRARAFKWIARAIATAWRCPPGSPRTGGFKVFEFGVRRPMTFRVAGSIAASASVVSRRSTSGTRPGAVPGAGVVGVIIVGSAHPPAHDRVEADGNDEDDPYDDVLGRRVDEQQHHARA